jgi:hypothetical protein
VENVWKADWLFHRVFLLTQFFHRMMTVFPPFSPEFSTEKAVFSTGFFRI